MLLMQAIADGLRKEPAASELRHLGLGLGLPVGAPNEAVGRAILDGVDSRRILVVRSPGVLQAGAPPAPERRHPQDPVIGSATVVPVPARVASLGLQQRFEAVLRRVPPYLPESMRVEFAALLEPGALAIAAGVFALWAVSQFTPVGWIADLVMLVGGGIMLGLAVFQIASLLAQAIQRTARARSEADLDAAARDFAEVVAKIGVAAFIALIARAGAKLRRRSATGGTGTAAEEAGSSAARSSRGSAAREEGVAGDRATVTPIRPGLRRVPTSGVPLQTDPQKTTTVLGNYGRDIKYVIEELGYPKTDDFGAKPGRFNVLNVPDDWAKDRQRFWDNYNRPFLDQAIARDDAIAMATRPTGSVLNTTLLDGTVVRSGFGREYDYLLSQGYRYDAASSTMVR